MDFAAFMALIESWRCAASLPCEWLPAVLGAAGAALFGNWKNFW